MKSTRANTGAIAHAFGGDRHAQRDILVGSRLRAGKPGEDQQRGAAKVPAQSYCRAESDRRCRRRR
ncbi:hypothetical protein ACWKWK_02780 [Pseudoxanthomonas beigongshangi]